MKNSIKLKGRLKNYLQTSIYLGVLLVLVNLGIYVIDYRAGLILTCFVVLYFAIVVSLLLYNKPIIMNELISFATQYGQIQRRLLRDLEAGKIIWTNIAFERAVHKEKGYRKSITSLFPAITKEKLPGDVDEVELSVAFEDNDYVAKMKKISLKEMARSEEHTSELQSPA